MGAQHIMHGPCSPDNRHQNPHKRKAGMEQVGFAPTRLTVLGGGERGGGCGHIMHGRSP